VFSRRSSDSLGLLGPCPRWDSNPHCAVFETALSAGWSTGAAVSVDFSRASLVC
jgi:hypothetical protein